MKDFLRKWLGFWTLSVIYFATLYLQTDRDPVVQSYAFSILTQIKLVKYQSRLKKYTIGRIRVEHNIYVMDLTPCLVHRIFKRNKQSCKVEIMRNIWVSTVSVVRNACVSPFAVCAEFQRPVISVIGMKLQYFQSRMFYVGVGINFYFLILQIILRWQWTYKKCGS
jgi:hypothetical protein